MQTDKDTFRLVPFPRARRLVTDIGWVSQSRPTIRGLLEIDVTEPRRLIHEHEARTGEKLSFTAFLTACVGHAVDQNKYLHAYRDWRGRLVLYDAVDIATMIEVERDGKKFPVGHIVRNANEKSFLDIHSEIRKVQTKPLGDKEAQSLYAVSALPRFLRRLLLRLMDRSPRLIKRYRGTVMLTAVGMFGDGGGWGMSLPTHTLGVTVGGIEQKPGIVAGQVAVREYLNVTLDFDHDIVDGAPAARFAQRLRTLVEGAHGLV